LAEKGCPHTIISYRLGGKGKREKGHVSALSVGGKKKKGRARLIERGKRREKNMLLSHHCPGKGSKRDSWRELRCGGKEIK